MYLQGKERRVIQKNIRKKLKKYLTILRNSVIIDISNKEKEVKSNAKIYYY